MDEFEHIQYRRRRGRWPIYPSYDITDGVLHADGEAVRWYRPAETPGIVGEVAKLRHGDEKGLLEFARRWGALGYRELRLSVGDGASEEENRLDDELVADPLQWIHAHIEGVRLCLELQHALAHRDNERLSVRMGAIREMANWEGRFFDEGYWSIVQHGAGYRTIDIVDLGGRTVGLPDGDLAAMIVAGIINANLKQASPRVLVADGQPSQSMDLLCPMIAVYWHLSRALVNEVGVGQCKECGAYFLQTSRRQLFCPPIDGATESRCSQRYRLRKFRSKSSTN